MSAVQGDGGGIVTGSDEDREEWIQGPPRDYDPPSTDELVDPKVRDTIRDRGAAAVLEVLAECGIRKVDGKWVRVEPE